MLDGDCCAEIKKMLEQRDWNGLKMMLPALPPSDVSEFITSLDDKDKVLLFRALPREFASEVFSEMGPIDQDHLIKQLSEKETSEILAEMAPDDRAAVFQELPTQVTWKLYKLLSQADAREVKKILGYPEESVGRLMTPDYIAVRPDWKVREVFEYIRKKGLDSETTSRIYVTDKNGRLLDDIRLRHIIVADPEKEVGELIKGEATTISAFEDQEKAVELIKKLNINALPVVDSNQAMVGIVTFDDLMDVAEKEVTEDFQRIAAISQTREDVFVENIKDASIKLLFRKRIFWLILLVFMNVFSGGAAALFEETIAKYIVLVFFMPLLIDSGGNAGAQTATLMVRALATGDVKQNDWLKMLGKEFLVAGLLGVTMGAAVSLIGLFRGGMEIALVVASSMVIIVVIGSVIGMSLPFIFTKMGRDPATASGPLITSICDITGIVVYFTLATRMLGI
ncbi:MAG TPA: magnesium transporter [Candidatus Altiarchaeales archaeon]|nr:magnesium transporter [Candidatus Altiarchaeales archaeon]